jgi:hypothetical protein
MWKKVLREYFSFSRKERRGVWFLWLLLILLLCWRVVKNKFYNKENLLSYRIIIYDELKKTDSVKLMHQWFAQKNKMTKQRKFYFNYVDVKTLIDLGISAKHAQMLIDKRTQGIKRPGC